jgi:hypothetical protein
VIDLYKWWWQKLIVTHGCRHSTFMYRGHRVTVSVAAVPGIGFCGFARVTYGGESLDVPTPSWYASYSDAHRRSEETVRDWIDAGLRGSK